MGDQERYVCEACGKSFDSEEELRRHVYAVGLVE
ncbi:C2H2-type zinc finger protein [Halorussus caseinilyticus]|uniref:C2H2-type zinc finger protein n=1 Tax=Halorussus caseinilyticus TaxID=3034025 RepID=A0ABD5WVC3_9EURY|nr:C2H2-type zinc finger protein [Halorussus sp. DT72]